MDYPQFRERLLRIAAEEEAHVTWLRDTLLARGGAIPTRSFTPKVAKIGGIGFQLLRGRPAGCAGPGAERCASVGRRVTCPSSPSHEGYSAAGKRSRNRWPPRWAIGGLLARSLLYVLIAQLLNISICILISIYRASIFKDRGSGSAGVGRVHHPVARRKPRIP